MSGASFEHKGESYFIPRIVDADKDRWHVYCNAFVRKQRAKDRRAVEEGWLDYGEYKLSADETQDRLDSGYYHYDERGGRAMLANDYLFVALVWICIARHDPSVTEAKFRAIASEVGPALGKCFADANPTQPAGSAGEDFQSTTKNSESISAADSSKNAS